MTFAGVLDDLESRINLNQEARSILRFMITSQRLRLSGIADEALEVAVRYLEGLATDTELQEARVACRHSIRGRDMNIADQEVPATRAVICALFPLPWSDDAFDILHAFGEFAEHAGAPSGELANALQACLMARARDA